MELKYKFIKDQIKRELFFEFAKKLKEKWKYLTFTIYDTKPDPNFEEEVESVFKELIEEYEKGYDSGYKTELDELLEMFNNLEQRYETKRDTIFKLETIQGEQLNELKAKVESLKDVEQSRDNIKEVLWDMLETKKQNTEKHLTELVDDPTIEAKFIKACEKQIEDAKRQLAMLGIGSARQTIKQNDPFKFCSKCGYSGNVRDIVCPECHNSYFKIEKPEKKEDCKHEEWTKCYDEDGNLFAQWCWKCGDVKYETEKKEYRFDWPLKEGCSKTEKKECNHKYIQDGINPPYCKYCLDENPPMKASETEKKEPKYICLKLEKEIDICRLINNLRYKITKENDITHPSDYNQDHLKKYYKWKDIVQNLLEVDGSWGKKPEFYHKYDIIKHKTEKIISLKDFCKGLLAEIEEPIKQIILSYEGNNYYMKHFIELVKDDIKETEKKDSININIYKDGLLKDTTTITNGEIFKKASGGEKE